MSAPYYADAQVTLYHGRCEDVLPTIADGAADLLLTDPPYSPATHDGARTRDAAAAGGDGRDRYAALLDPLHPDGSFDAITADALRAVLAQASRVVRRWAVLTCDWRHVGPLAEIPPAGLRFVRFGVWVKPDSAPQFTGDRPGPGWEAVAFLHRTGVPLAWHGGGRRAVFTHYVVRGERRVHPTEKPAPLARELIGLLTNPGDTVLDLYAGSGTTLRAAKDMGRRAIGVEAEERWCEAAAQKLAQHVLDFADGAA